MKDFLKNLSKLTKNAKNYNFNAFKNTSQNHEKSNHINQTKPIKNQKQSISTLLVNKFKQYISVEENQDKQKQQKNQSSKDHLNKQYMHSLFDKYKSNIYEKLPKTKQYYQKGAQQLKKYSQKIHLHQTKQSLKKTLGQLQEKSSHVKQNLEKTAEKLQKKTKQSLYQNSDKIKHKLQDSKEFLGKSASQMKDSVLGKSGQIYQDIKQKIDIKKKAEKTFNFIFWRVALLLGIIAFSYGIGTTIPRQMKNLAKQYVVQQDNQNKTKT